MRLPALCAAAGSAALLLLAGTAPALADQATATTSAAAATAPAAGVAVHRSTLSPAAAAAAADAYAVAAGLQRHHRPGQPVRGDEHPLGTGGLDPESLLRRQDPHDLERDEGPVTGGGPGLRARPARRDAMSRAGITAAAVLVVAAAVGLGIGLGAAARSTPPEPAQPVGTEAPGPVDSGYWTDQRRRSAAPAPMPTAPPGESPAGTPPTPGGP
jgi:hypothetical protein